MSSTWLVPIAVAAIFALFRRFLPVPEHRATSQSVEDLSAEFGRSEKWGLVMFFVFAPVAGLLWWLLLVFVFPEGGFEHAESTYSLRPERLVWALPAMLLGILSAAPLLELAYRRILKDRYDAYVAYQNLRYGFDTEAIGRPLLGGGGVLSAVAVIAIANWSAVFSPTDIVLNSFFSFNSRTYAYTDVMTIHSASAFVAPNGNTVQRQVYEVGFDDSTKWTTLNNPSEASDSQLESLIEDVSARSGVPVVVIPLLTRD